LDSKIAAEKTARETAVQAEAAERSTQDGLLDNKITAEATVRESADTVLQSNIEDEEARATGVEAALNTAI